MMHRGPARTVADHQLLPESMQGLTLLSPYEPPWLTRATSANLLQERRPSNLHKDFTHSPNHHRNPRPYRKRGEVAPGKWNHVPGCEVPPPSVGSPGEPAHDDHAPCVASWSSSVPAVPLPQSKPFVRKRTLGVESRQSAEPRTPPQRRRRRYPTRKKT